MPILKRKVKKNGRSYNVRKDATTGRQYILVGGKRDYKFMQNRQQKARTRSGTWKRQTTSSTCNRKRLRRTCVRSPTCYWMGGTAKTKCRTRPTYSSYTPSTAYTYPTSTGSVCNRKRLKRTCLRNPDCYWMGRARKTKCRTRPWYGALPSEALSEAPSKVVSTAGRAKRATVDLDVELAQREAAASGRTDLPTSTQRARQAPSLDEEVRTIERAMASDIAATAASRAARRAGTYRDVVRSINNATLSAARSRGYLNTNFVFNGKAVFAQQLGDGIWRYYYEYGPAQFAKVDKRLLKWGHQFDQSDCAKFVSRQTCLQDPRTNICEIKNNRCQRIDYGSNENRKRAYYKAMNDVTDRGYINEYGV